MDISCVKSPWQPVVSEHPSWTLLSVAAITVVIGYTVCSRHIRMYTDSFYCWGFRRECRTAHKNKSGAQRFLWKATKKKVCVCGSTCVSVWLPSKEISHFNTTKDQTTSHVCRCFCREVPHQSRTEGERFQSLVWQRPQHKTTNNTQQNWLGNQPGASAYTALTSAG